jgi:hypothetical protein
MEERCRSGLMKQPAVLWREGKGEQPLPWRRALFSHTHIFVLKINSSFFLFFFDRRSQLRKFIEVNFFIFLSLLVLVTLTFININIYSKITLKHNL